MSEQKDDFVVRGTVKSRSGRPMAGFEVTAFDQDFLGKDLLGRVKTDAQGRFEVRFKRADFDGPLEGGPDIYLQVVNDRGQAVHLVDNAIRKNAGQELVYHIELDESDAAEPQLHLARKHYGTLSKLGNKKLQRLSQLLQQQSITNFLPDGNMSYEQLHCIGLRRKENLLEAIFEVKLPYGYGGRRCTDGSTEWVTFWVDYGSGVWEQVAEPVPTVVHDLEATAGGSVWYAAFAAFDPQKHLQSCKNANFVRLRATLSWAAPHLDPLTPPVWGNTEDAWIVLRNAAKFPGIQVFPGFEIELPVAPFPVAPVNLAMLQGLKASIATIEEATHAGEVHLKGKRKDHLAHIAANPNYYGGIVKSKDPQQIAAALAQLPPDFWKVFPGAVLPKDLLPQVPGDSTDPSFEQLTCLGLVPSMDMLESTIAVKLPYGYGGGLCGMGSTEYVAYYLDYGAGWEYVGTDEVTVHDVAAVDSQRPLMYASRMPVAGMRERARQCGEEQVVRARAILSWSVDPTPFGPDYSPVYGNALDRRVEVAPTRTLSQGPRIDFVSEVSVGAIDPGTGLVEAQRPFGRHLGIRGNVVLSGASHYRLRYRKAGDAAWSTGMASRPAQRSATSTATDWRPVSGEGWFRIDQYLADAAIYPPTILCYFDSVGFEGRHELRLEVGDGIVPLASSPVVQVRLDNKLPEFFHFEGEIIPNEGVTVKYGGEFKNCGSFMGNEAVEVWGNFRDDHYGFHTLRIVGGGSSTWQDLPAGATLFPVTASGTSISGDGTRGQHIATFSMSGQIKCAYAVELTVHDKTIVGHASSYYFGLSHHADRRAVTFTYEP